MTQPSVPSSPSFPATLKDFFAARDPVRASFIAAHVRKAGAPVLIGEDWGTRRYYRVPSVPGSYILMESVPDHFPFAAPGHRIDDFIRLSAALRFAGLHAPEVIAADADEGYVLLEDMGDVSFYDAIRTGGDEYDLYALSVDVLSAMEHAFPDNAMGLPHYADTHIHKGRRRIIDWYAPMMRGALNPDGMAEGYLSVWQTIERALPHCPMGFVHGDYHAQNLMWRGHAEGLARCGILDFQGAMWGPLPYDLSNLLGDIRRDIDPALADDMVARRTAGMTPGERDAFMAWYPVLKMQFHCRVIGQVIRLAAVQGKTRHLVHMPRLQNYMREGLKDPLLAPLAAWFGAHGIAFDAPPVIDEMKLRDLIRPDAF